ncbi:MAG: nuclear transport factor 2 family protein [Rhodococcus sp. (in: high G+C Gram-positive bacteria)]|uniref:nuclear transport factor 2 family protein n=1 Tax=Rhodococcus sp. TaxID=1831 RepID=UPI003BB51CE7
MTNSGTAPRTELIRSTVTAYLAAVASGTADTIAALYTEDATVEDPVGSEPRAGRDAITEFYRALESMKTSTELFTLRVAGNEAAFSFRVDSEAAGQTYRIEPIDVMTFDDEGRITSMRAFWSPEDMRAL